MSKQLIALFLAFLLVGCTSPSQPIPAGYHGPLAKIADSMVRLSPKTLNFYEIVKVDGRPVASSSEATLEKGSFTFTPTLLQRNVPAQKCVLTLRATQFRERYGSDHDDKKTGDGPMYVLEGEITVILDPNEEYVVTGFISHFDQSVFLQSRDRSFRSAKIEWHDATARKDREKREEDQLERAKREIERIKKEAHPLPPTEHE